MGIDDCDGVRASLLARLAVDEEGEGARLLDLLDRRGEAGVRANVDGAAMGPLRRGSIWWRTAPEGKNGGS